MEGLKFSAAQAFRGDASVSKTEERGSSPRRCAKSEGRGSIPPTVARYSQRVNGICHVLSATGAAVAAKPLISLLDPALCLSSAARITPRLAIAGRGFSRG